MPRRLAALLLLLAPLACFEAAPDRCLPDADGLLNPDFECAPDAESAIRGWSLLPDYAEGATLGLAADPDGGTTVAQLQSSDDGWHGASQVIEAQDLVGEVLRLFGRVRVEGQATAGLSLFLEGARNTLFFESTTLDRPSAGEWSGLRTLALPYDERADHLRLVLWIEGQGRAWFDDLQLAPSERDSLESWDRTCKRGRDCAPDPASCVLGRCVPHEVLAGELAAPDIEIRRSAFESIWRTADQRAPGFVARPDLDWDAAYDHYLSQVEAAGSLGEWGGAITRLIAEFRDGHARAGIGAVTYYHTRGVVFSGMSSSIGCTTRTLDDRIAVYLANEGNPLGLEVGDEILGFDGRGWQELEAEIYAGWDSLQPYGYSATSETSRRWAFAGAILGNRHFFHETVEIRRAADGSIDSLELSGLPDGKGMLFCADRPGFANPEESFEGGDYWQQGAVLANLIEDDRIVYATVRGMNEQTRDQTRQLLEEHPDTRGLIWDLRLNPGGLLVAGQPIWQALMAGGERIMTNHLAQRDALGEPGRTNMITNGKEWMEGSDLHRYDGKVALLVGPNSFSAADALPWMLAHLPDDRVRRFGLATAGAFSGYSMGSGNYPVDAGPYSGFFEFVMPDFVMQDAADGRYLTGTDQYPEELVWLTPEGLAAGRDDVVDAAVAWILGD